MVQPTAGDLASLRGATNVEANLAGAGAGQRILEAAGEGGAAATSGRVIQALGDRRRGTGFASGIGRGAAELEGRTIGTEGLLKLSAYGRGLADQSIQSLAESGRTATRAALDHAEAESRADASRNEGIASLIGYGTNQVRSYLNRPQQPTTPSYGSTTSFRDPWSGGNWTLNGAGFGGAGGSFWSI